MLSIVIIAFTVIVVVCRVCLTIEKMSFYKENAKVRSAELKYGYDKGGSQNE